MEPLELFRPEEPRAWFERTAPLRRRRAAPPSRPAGTSSSRRRPGSGRRSRRSSRRSTATNAGLRLLYVSPLKTLNYALERNLRGPLAGLRRRSESQFARATAPEGARRDAARAAWIRPPRTSELSRLLLTSRAREALLRSVDTLILDEVHAVAGTKRWRPSRSRSSGLEGAGGQAATTDRPLGRSARSRRSAASSRVAARSSSSTRASRRSSTSRSSSRSRMREPGGESREEGWEPRSIWPSIYPRSSAPAPRASVGPCLRQQPPPCGSHCG